MYHKHTHIHMHTHISKNARSTIYLDFRKTFLDLKDKRNILAAGWSGKSGQLGPNGAAKWIN